MQACNMDVWTSSFFFLSSNRGSDSTAVAKSVEGALSDLRLLPPVPSDVLDRMCDSRSVTSCNSVPLLSIASGKGLNLCRL